ncbi:MAG: hypothetical protein IJI96_05375 [Methanobrevibacter sp.]|nr:hypothetical protein [Methanobrevibacter sp.]MBQ6627733.1 hypothetical protein [Methanobrevibacter sp.]
MDNNDFKEEIEFVNALNDDDELFEREFNNVQKDFPFQNFDEIHRICSNHRGLIVLLNKAKPLLEEHVPYASVHLELDDDPIFSPQLLVVVKALQEDFDNGFKDDIKLIKSELRALVIKLNLTVEFFIWDTSCTPYGKSSLSMHDLWKDGPCNYS